jgi:acyl carrier protein
MKEFCQQIADILEVESLSEADVLSDFPEWDSLSILSLIAMIDSTYGANVTASEVREAATPAGLWQLIASRKKA